MDVSVAEQSWGGAFGGCGQANAVWEPQHVAAWDLALSV